MLRILLSTALFYISFSSLIAKELPNILWITAEDMSPTLGCYGDAFADTPHIDKLASESTLYTHAFASSPVCSPSRSCIINGLYATTQGTHNMRSAFPIPDYMKGFPSFLRGAGYYTTNNVKTDYNSGNFEDIIKASWDESSSSGHWRNGHKKSGKPFFSVFNLMTSHQSRTMVWPYEKFVQDVQAKLPKSRIHDPSKVPLPPYYPDTPIVRKTLARYYDCVSVMDSEVGDLLQQLGDDDLADDTIVFFYSDHGSGMPRHKRALLDSGMRVALMVRFPEKWKHLAPTKPGLETDRLVSFVDFGPTVLSLAKVKVPEWMEGQSFLGESKAKPRKYVFGHRNRVDEVHDLARSVRDKRYLYIRNYMPHLGYNQPTAWPDLGEIRHEFYRLVDSGEMTPAQLHFAGSTRPLEELYDCQADPQNLNNLADSKDHLSVLVSLRKQLAANIRKTRDLGFLAEALAWDLSKGTTLYELARSKRKNYSQSNLLKAANQVGSGKSSSFISSLRKKDPAVRYWGAVGLAASDHLDEKSVASLEEALKDSSVTVRIEAANALARHGLTKSSIPVLSDSLENENLAAVQHAARTIELLGATAKTAVPAMKACDARMKVIRPPGTSPVVVQPDKDAAMFVLFSTEAFLKRFGH
ncbi:MAG: sulfatase-like hydrolase/transferase [Opitutae bacterium]